ncbi:MAG: hypothetical protein ACFE8E_13650, partial [Candidatus Hodarchaeota archaeon]
MKRTKKGVLYTLILFIVISSVLPIFQIKPIRNLMENRDQDSTIRSSDITTTKQWITNGGFDTLDNWTLIEGSLGDPTDVNAYIGGGEANYEVLGSEDRFTFEEKYNMVSSWVKSNHPDFPVDPSYGQIVAGQGFRAEHYWND